MSIITLVFYMNYQPRLVWDLQKAVLQPRGISKENKFHAFYKKMPVFKRKNVKDFLIKQNK